MEVGALVGERFELDELVTEGGMGRVYRARDRTTGEAVALKVVEAQEPAVLERFTREAALLGAQAHPGIVRYVGHGASPTGDAWLAMEWLEGEDLRTRLERQGLSVDETVELGRRVAEALGALHASGVVHRDVKPANLHLGADDVRQVKLLDLGVARFDDAPALTRTGSVIGTPAYMAPEQAQGQRGLDARADIFALGVVLYECLAGHAPFDGAHVVAVLAKVLFEEVPPLIERCDGVPAALSDLVARMLEKDRERRPRDGADVARAFASLASGLDSGSARRPRPRERRPEITAEEQEIFCVVLGRGPAPFDTLMAAVDAYGAELTMLADGSMLCTLEGGPGGLVAQASRAARFALALGAAVPSMELALATGRAVPGRLPIGDVVDRAAALTRGSGIAVDGSTARLIEERFELGRDGARVWLLGERRAPLGAQTFLGKPTPCVGREREIALLEGFLSECIDEPMGRPVLVTGEAGRGKSRLCYEVMRRIEARPERVTVWLGRGDPLSAGSAFGLISRALERAAGVRDGGQLDDRRRRLDAFVSRRLPGAAAREVTDFLGEMLGVPFPEDSSAPLRAARADARLMADQTRRAFEELVLAECEDGPLVLVLEDLQWGDLPSLSYVGSALRVLGERPWLVLALARPEVHDVFPGLWADRGVQELRLEPLRPRAARTLVHAVLGESVSPTLVGQLVDRAAGNAFALEEIIRAQAEGRRDDLPDTVLGLVEARLARLEPEARRVLRAASVFGESFWEEGVRALAREAAEWLETLADLELVTRRVESRLSGQRELAFRHGLVREACYAMLTPEDLRLGHRLAGEWLERAGETDVLVLAEHWERAGESERAAQGYMAAAQQALSGDDLSAVLDRAERGLRCAVGPELRGELLLSAAEAHRWRGENADAIRCASEAIELLPRAGSRFFEAAGELASTRQRLGDIDALARLGDDLLAAEPDPSEAAAASIGLVRVGTTLLQAGRTELGSALYDRAERLGRSLATIDPAVAARLERARGLRALYAGDPAVYLESCLAAATHDEESGNRRSACIVRANAAYGMLLLGAHARAETVLRESLTSARRMGLRGVEAGVLNNLGLALARQGRLREAEEAKRAAIEHFHDQGDRRLEGASRAYLAEILAGGGDLAAARSEALAAISLVEKAAPPLHAWALGVLARIELARGDIPTALATAREARALLDACGGAAEEGEGLVRLCHAEALAAAGEHEAAREALHEAQARLFERAARVSDPELRRSFLEAIPEHARTLELARAAVSR